MVTNPLDLQVSLWRLVWRRWLNYLSDFSSLAAVIVGIVALVSVSAKDILDWWVSSVLLAIVAFGSVTSAILDVLRQRTVWLQGLYAVPQVALELGPELDASVEGVPKVTRLVRVVFTNESIWSRSFVATAVELHGITGPEAPWPVRWRHETDRAHLLYPGDREMLDVAGIARQPGHPDRLELYLAGPHGAPVVDLGPNDVSIRINVWDGVSVQPCADFTLTIQHPHRSAPIRLDVVEPRPRESAAHEDPTSTRRRRVTTVATVVALLIALAVGWLLSRPKNPADESAEAGFARDMAFHHAQAVEMAELIRSRSSDQTLDFLAKDILLTQQAQIGIMRGWLSAWNLNAVSIGQEPMAWSGMNMDGQMPGLATAGDLESLTTLPIAEAEVRFLQLMIEHHRGGVHMANAVLSLRPAKPVEGLARSIVRSQESEIRAMTEMLQARGAEP